MRNEEIDLSGLAPSAADDLRSILEDAQAATESGDTVGVERALEDVLGILEDETGDVVLPHGCIEELRAALEDFAADPATAQEIFEALLDALNEFSSRS